MPTQKPNLTREFRVRLNVPNKSMTCTITGSELHNVQQAVTALLTQATNKPPKFMGDDDRQLTHVYHDSFESGHEPLATINEIQTTEQNSVHWIEERRKEVGRAA